MTFTVTDKYDIPTHLCWCVNTGGYSGGLFTTAPQMAGTYYTYLHLAFHTQAGIQTCGCEWQVYGRKRPSANQGWDTWENLSNIYASIDQNVSLVDGWFHSTEHRTSHSDILRYWSLTDTTRFLEHDFPFNIALFNSGGALVTYDLIRFSFRVRVQDDSSQQCTEWQYQDLYLSFNPTLSSFSIDNDLNLSITSNWERGFTLTPAEVYRDHQAENVDKKYTSATPIEFSPTANNISVGKWIEDSLFTYEYNGSYRSNIEFSEWRAIDINLRTYGGIREFTYNLSLGDWDATLSRVSATNDIKAKLTLDEEYTIGSLNVNAYYTDPLRGVITLYSIGDNQGNITVECPPYDVPVTIVCTVTALQGTTPMGMKVVSATYTLNSDGAATLYDGTTLLKIQFDNESEENFNKECDTAKPVGKISPLSRYGVGGTRSIKLSGTLLNSNVDFNFYHGDKGMWRNGLVALESPHDWVYRAPGGVRRNVMIKSYSASERTRTLNVAIEVNIEMIEVE